MQDSSDGFLIAEKDLAIRGPGELLGTRQTGLAAFRIALLPEHEDLLTEAQEIAATLRGRSCRGHRHSCSAGQAPGQISPGFEQRVSHRSAQAARL